MILQKPGDFPRNVRIVWFLKNFMLSATILLVGKCTEIGYFNGFYGSGTNLLFSRFCIGNCMKMYIPYPRQTIKGVLVGAALQTQHALCRL